MEKVGEIILKLSLVLILFTSIAYGQVFDDIDSQGAQHDKKKFQSLLNQNYFSS